MAQFYTFEDLRAGKFSENENFFPSSLSGEIANSKNFAVLGFPVKHSLSPIMHSAALAEIAKDDASYKNSKYFAFEIAPENLCEALKILLELNFVGINLTIPHKEAAFEILKDCHTSAADARACNTLLNCQGHWQAFNTDGFGLQMAIEKCFGAKMENLHVYILGAGGAARGVAFHLARMHVKSLHISNRSKPRLENLISDLRSSGFTCSPFDLGDVEFPSENCLIINATSLGLNAHDAPVLDFEKVPLSAIFFDMPYICGAQTSSVDAAKKCGIRAESGLPMLAYQGAKSLQIWTSKDFKGDVMLSALRNITSRIK